MKRSEGQRSDVSAETPGTMFSMSPEPRRRLIAALASLAAIAGLAACSTITGDGADPTAPVPSLTFDVTTTVAAPSTSTTLAPTSTSLAPASTVEATQPPVPTTIAVTTTTEPIALQELILTGDGLGSAQFGADPDEVVEYVTSILGSPT